MTSNRVTKGEGTVAANPAMESPKVSPATDAGADSSASSSSQWTLPAHYELRVLKALRRIIRAVDLHSRKLSARHNITGPQLICLLSVREHEPVTTSAVARHVHLSPSTVIGILDRLESKGLIRRERDRKDRRLVQVSVTEPGSALVESAPSPLQDAFADAMSKLPEPELVTIAESLERIVRLMELQHIDAAPILETGPIDPVSGGADL